MEIFRVRHLDPRILAKERERVHSLLSACDLPGRVIEAGSTAVPGLVGKGDLDFLVLVSAAEFSVAREILDHHFSRNPEQLANEQYQGYKVESNMDVAIQLTIEGGRYDTFETFLEILNSSAEVREHYNRLKYAYDGKSMQEYREAKSAFIEKALSASDIRRTIVDR